MENDFPVLQTARLLLRQFTAPDLQNVFKGLSHPEVTRYYGVSYQTELSTIQQMDFFESLEKNNTGRWWAVCSCDNKDFYGGCGLNNYVAAHRKAEIGFWLLPEFWGRGIISEAIELVCNYGFKNMNLHRIEAIIESDNQRSKKTVEKMKFAYEGTMQECEIKNGQFISLDIYAKLNKKGNT